MNRVDLERLWSAARSQRIDVQARHYASGTNASDTSESSLRILYKWCLESPNPDLKRMAKEIESKS